MYINNIGLDFYIWINEFVFVVYLYCINLWCFFNINRYNNFNSNDIDKWNVYVLMLFIFCNSL